MKRLCSSWFLEYGRAKRQRVVHRPYRVRLPGYSEEGSSLARQPGQTKRLVEPIHWMKSRHSRRTGGMKPKERVWPSGMARIEGAALAQ